MSRESLLDHVVDVIADDGMGGLSVRTVATRAGVAIGTVQHWFPTKSAMLLAAMDRIGVIADSAYRQAVVADDPAERLRETVALLVPTGRESKVSRVWLAFAAQAVADDEVRARYEQLWAGIQHGLVRRLAEAAPQATAAAIDDAASELLALSDGLAVAVLDEPARMPAERARAMVLRRTDEIIAALRR
ncbi:TetR/AcrR family transcriptional regulator [Microbacterium sp. NPDC057659]|uniref:TetR/AcrR family transcriptional regulator n=1 Tax=Microbacterium sp. NPDC057659 TaxID=3346198 RepID=UPI003671025C